MSWVRKERQMENGKIEIQNVTFAYLEDEVLRNVSLSIPEGSCVLLCGESGCGKTSITKLINGLIPHFSEEIKRDGRVLINGEEVADRKMWQLTKYVGSVFQNPKSQFFYMDSDSELAFVLENEGVPEKKLKERVGAVVSKLQVEDLLHRSLFAMSGGEKQLLAFASVYAGDPEIYVLDEPSSNLDADAMERLHKQIGVICSQGKTVVIAEHRLSYVADLIDYAVYVKNGEICEMYDGDAFRALSQEQLSERGLRSIRPVNITKPIRPFGEKSSEIWDLQVKNLSVKRGKRFVLSHLNFGVNFGEILGIIGRNGAGKSTLLRCLCGLEKERDGEILVNGKRMKPKERIASVYMVMQDVNHQLFGESVWDECEMIAGDGARENIENVLKQFDLIEEKERHPLSLSGGQKQRLVLATAILGKRRILVLDEPTSGLDYRHMKDVSRQLQALAEQGYMILIVSHDVEFLNASCDRCIFIE